MIVKIHTPQATPKGGNKGSSENLFSYLTKEDEKKDIFERTGFFNQNKDQLSKSEAILGIDQNKGRLSKTENKFYMITINPSQKELSHLMPIGKYEVSQLRKSELKEYESKLMLYTREVMANYARSFNKNISSNDLVYYAKVEHEREYKGDEAKKLGLKDRTKKEGLQSHVHVVVSRYDKAQKMKISPLSKKRARSNNTSLNGNKTQQGFNQLIFRMDNEKTFDKAFGYQRSKGETVLNRLESAKSSFNKGLINQTFEVLTNKELSPLKRIRDEYRKQDTSYIFRSELKKMNPISNTIKAQEKILTKGLTYGNS